eukprot:TRINITY_DN3622_c0_g1_i3.p1 TRINITY_DN3622_c0_g1~~TRINITY_DN3622_c0_g1_i3.p1  ORF type:complete len:814 (+),score=254.81 TRINITY_DN3622_c0_g1_i3:64-2505(+)
MEALWDQFTAKLGQKDVSVDGLLRATEAELEEIFTDLGYRALERAQLRTIWYDKKSKLNGAEIPIVAQTAVVPTSSREYLDVKVLVDHYVCPDPSMTVSIVELERISNPVLQKRFERRKSELTDGSNGVVVRRFHSPVSSNGSRKIQDIGFSLPANGPQQCLRFLTKAPAAHPPGAYKLLLCDVAVGKYKAVSGDGASITPEQLASEAYDSVYLFYSSGNNAGDTPDEFILFHPDQVLPRHVVTFLVHPCLSPLRSPRSPVDQSLNQSLTSHEIKRELSFQTPSRYWIVSENQLVDGDSLLVGPHKGKDFMSLQDGTDKQAHEIETKNDVLAKSLEHLRQQLGQLREAEEKQRQKEEDAIQNIDAQSELLHKLVDERREDAVRLVQSTTAAVTAHLEDDVSTVQQLIEALEVYASKVADILNMASSRPEEFVLKSKAFLKEMDKWQPSYDIHTKLSLPPPIDLAYDVSSVQRALDALIPSEHTSKRRENRAERKQRADMVPLPLPEYGKIIVEQGEASVKRSTRRQRSPEGRQMRAHTPQVSKQRHRSLTPNDVSLPPAHPLRGQQQQQQHHHHHHQQQHYQHPPAWEDLPPQLPPQVPMPAPGPSPAPSRGMRSRSNTPNKRPGRSVSRSKVPSFHVVIVGEAGVGKTRLMEAWMGEDPPKGDALMYYEPSLEPRSFPFTVISSKGKMQVTVTDTPGSQLFPEALENVDAAVVMFDCTNYTTYNNSRQWYSYLPYHIPVALCGNKSNEAGRVIKSKDITFHKEVNNAIKETLMNYYDISVASRYNIDKPWTWICRKLMKDSHLVVKEIISAH